MEHRVLRILLAAFMVCLAASWLGAMEKLNLGSGTRESPPYYLAVTAAEEKGFWKENGLEVTWVPLRGAARLERAVETGAIQIAISTAPNVFVARVGGGTNLIVSDFAPLARFYIWVPVASRIREAKDLKGARVGTTQIGGLTYTYGQVLFKALAMEKEVRFVGTGGINPTIAALKSGAIDASISAFYLVAELKFRGQLREVIYVNDYLPKPLAHHVFVGNGKYVKASPAAVRKVLKASLQATGFVKDNPGWAVKKITAESGVSEPAAKAIYEELGFFDKVWINKEGLENVRNFLIEYRLIPKEKAPTVQEVTTTEFAG